MKKIKRSGALLLSLVLAISLAVPAYAAAEGTGYSDVDAGASYAEAVIWCREHELMNGVGNGRFAPEGNLTRAALATVLWRLEGEPVVNYLMQFSDVGDDWYTEAVRWAASEQIMGGYGGGIFGANDPVTRQDMATILYRYANSPEISSGESYDDENSIAGYAAAAVDWASANGIVSALSGNTFAPQASATRAQIAIALMNFSRIQRPDPTSPVVTTQNPNIWIISLIPTKIKSKLLNNCVRSSANN